MKKLIKNFKYFASGSVLTVIFLTSVVTSAQTQRYVEAVFGKMELVVDGKSISEENLIYNDTAYFPIRSISNALGVDLHYDETTHTIHVEEKNTTDEKKSAKWSYEGSTGPEYWGDLHPDYSIMKTGREQSPIDVKTNSTDKSQTKSDVSIYYGDAMFELVNNGHAIEGENVSTSNNNYVMLNNKRYDLIQFHMHASSEHTIDGKSFPMEIHFVNQAADGTFAVVGVLMEVGSEDNKEFGEFFRKMPSKVGNKTKLLAPINISKFLPQNLSMYRYDGSFTTPPGTEGVSWVLLKNTVTVSREQLEAHNKIYNGTNRPVQPLYDRIVKEHQ